MPDRYPGITAALAWLESKRATADHIKYEREHVAREDSAVAGGQHSGGRPLHERSVEELLTMAAQRDARAGGKAIHFDLATMTPNERAAYIRRRGGIHELTPGELLQLDAIQRGKRTTNHADR